MIIDITGTILIPGNQGKDCPGTENIPVLTAAVMNVIICSAVWIGTNPANTNPVLTVIALAQAPIQNTRNISYNRLRRPSGGGDNRTR